MSKPETGSYKIMKKASVREIARHAGVAPCTVSRVLSDCPGVTEATRRHVLAVARSLGSRAFALQTSYTVALILPPLAALQLYEHLLLEALRLEIETRGLAFEMFTPPHLGLLDSRMVAGAISICYNREIERRFADVSRIPLVSINNFSSHLKGIYTVNSDETSAQNDALRYLAAQGHQRIGLVGRLETRGNFSHSFRQEGFLNAVKSGMAYGELLKGERPLALILEEAMQKKLTALIIPYELVPLELEHAARKTGIRIPEDLSVILWETPPYSEQMEPPATTFGQDFRALASESLTLLDKLIRGERAPLRDLLIAYRFQERQSVKAKCL